MNLLYRLQMNNNQSFLRRLCIYVYVNVEHTELTAVLCVTPTQALQGRDIKQMLSSLIIFTQRLTVTQAREKLAGPRKPVLIHHTLPSSGAFSVISHFISQRHSIREMDMAKVSTHKQH